MNSIKQALEKDLSRHEDGPAKAQLSHMLFQRILQKKQKQDEKIKILMLLIILLFFIFSGPFSVRMPELQTIISCLLVLAVLIFTDICLKMLGVLYWWK